MRMANLPVLLLIGVFSVAAAPAAERLEADAPIDAVLDALHARGEDLRDFQSEVRLIETDEALGQATSRLGTVWYQNAPDEQARIRVTFTQREQRNMLIDERVEYMLERGWLIDRDYRRQVEVRRQVLRPDERIDLLRLGEGPFPLPIGQPREEVHRLFDVQRVDPSADDPAATIRLRLIPRPGTQFERRFESIDAWVDLESHMPVRIETVDANQITVRMTELSDIQVNVGLGDEHFRLPAIDERQWDRHDEPFVE
jgi:hypothetical protein